MARKRHPLQRTFTPRIPAPMMYEQRLVQADISDALKGAIHKASEAPLHAEAQAAASVKGFADYHSSKVEWHDQNFSRVRVGDFDYFWDAAGIYQGWGRYKKEGEL